MPGRRVLLKASGELLAGSGSGLDPDRLEGLAGALLRASSSGWRIGVVTGGGNIVRGRDVPWMSRVTADQMGMLATLVNALALRDALTRAGGMATVLCAFPVPGVARAFFPAEAVDMLDAGQVLIYAGGTGNPFLTTDTAAALRAVQTGCARLLKGTKVDGIYERDPERHPDAVRLDRLHWDEALRLGLGVMDAAAVAVCRDAGLPITVFDMRDPASLAGALEDPTLGSTIDGGQR